jgi:hypothetical protein
MARQQAVAQPQLCHTSQTLSLELNFALKANIDAIPNVQAHQIKGRLTLLLKRQGCRARHRRG